MSAADKHSRLKQIKADLEKDFKGEDVTGEEGSSFDGPSLFPRATPDTPEYGSGAVELHGTLFGPMTNKYPIEKIQTSEGNELFRKMKNGLDLAILKTLIKEQGVTNPLLIAEDGELLAGESRLLVCRELVDEGFTAFRRVPVRKAITPMTAEEKQEFRVSDNTSRFQVPTQAEKLTLLYAVYPNFFGEDFQNTETKHGGKTVTMADLAEMAGLSIRQIRRNARVIEEAKKKSGGRKPTYREIESALEKANEQRRARENKKKQQQRLAPPPLKTLPPLPPKESMKQTRALIDAGESKSVEKVVNALLSDKIIIRTVHDHILMLINEQREG